jgi:putative ABC transport system permease protein
MTTALPFHQAFRSLARTPGFTVGVLATFALGIGVNTAVFSAAWTLLLAPPPLREPQRVVAIWETFEAEQRRPVAPANFLDWRREAKSLAGAASYFHITQVLDVAGEPRRLSVAQVSSQFFDVLGVEPAAGRLFVGGETAPLAVVSTRLWRDTLGGAAVAGRTLRLDGESYEVVGVAPGDFDLPAGAEVWTVAAGDVAKLRMAIPLDPENLRDARYLGVYARLAPGVSVAEADRELAAIAARLAAAYPDENEDCGARVVPLAADLAAGVRAPVVLLGAGAGAVLLLACTNVAGLLLARGLARRRELAVRAALGAGCARLVGASLAEAALLAAGGGALGLAFAAWAAPWLVSALPGGEIAGRGVGLEPAVVAFALLAVLLAALATAAVPALDALRVAPAAALAGGRGALGPRRGGLRRALVVAQVALAVLLVAGALLIVRTLDRLTRIDPGFRADGVTTMRLWTPTRVDVPQAERRDLLARAIEAAAATPGVESAGAVLKLPLTGASFSAGLRVEGREVPSNEQPDVSWRVVGGDYFATMGVALRAGRWFAADEPATGPLVGVVNETLARQLFPGADPIGRRVATGLDVERDADWVTIVGVVADTPQEALNVPARPELYRPLAQPNRFGNETLALAVRTGPGFSIAALRERLRGVSPELVMDAEQPMSALLRRATARERLLGALLAGFGALALGLAAIGIHGVLALLVAERRREMGIRLAVGATAADLRALVARHGATQAAAGAAIGLAGALALGRALGGWLWQVSPPTRGASPAPWRRWRPPRRSPPGCRRGAPRASTPPPCYATSRNSSRTERSPSCSAPSICAKPAGNCVGTPPSRRSPSPPSPSASASPPRSSPCSAP